MICLNRAKNLSLTSLFLSTVVFLGSAQPALAYYQPTLLKDINPGTGSMGGSSNRVSMGDGRIFFEATDGTHGYELWISDGTEAGTKMVKDLDTDNNALEIANLTNVNGTLFFTDKVGTDYHLYKTDGTAAGTVLVKNLGTYYNNVYDNQGFALGSYFFFVNSDGTNGYELWRSDGTDSGTVMLKDINSGASNGFWQKGVVVGSIYYFVANDGTNGYELWKTDGTEAGTVMVKDVNVGGSSLLAGFTNVNGTLFFTADNGTNGVEVWTSDGSTAGTTIVKDLASGATSSNPSQLVSFQNKLFFWTQIGATYSIYQTDGTDAGTTKVTDVVAKPKSHGGTYSVAVAGDYLFFSMDDSGTYGEELYRTDGTAIGTKLVKDIYPGADDSESSNFIAFNNTLYFQANDVAALNYELWQSDGTEAGTFMTKDISLNAIYPDSDPTAFVVSGNHLFFQVWLYQTLDTEWYIIDLDPPVVSTPVDNSTPLQQPSSTTTPVCGDLKPVSAPDLFQIDVKGTSAKLFFAPLANTNRFFISFSTKANAEEHGEDVTLTREGVQSHTVYYLNPNTTYYFKVRGQNGCMAGDWSRIMKVTSGSKGTTAISKFFKNAVTQSSVVSAPMIKKVSAPVSKTIKVTTATPTPTEAQVKITPAAVQPTAAAVQPTAPTKTPSTSLWQKIVNFFGGK